MLYVYSIVAAKRFKTALIARCNRAELPIAVVAVNFADNERCFDGEILNKVEAENLLAVLVVGIVDFDNADVGV